MIVTWSIIILATISLIVFIQRNSKKREKKFYSVLQSFANDNNSKISSYDRWDKTLIGIDTSEISKLFFIRTISDKEFKEVINLSEVKKCRLIKTERTVWYNKENVKVIDKIELIFSYIFTNKPDIALEFYNNDYDHLTLSGELQLAQKWLDIVDRTLATNQNWEKETNKAKIQATYSIKEPVGHSHVADYGTKRKAKYAIHAI